MICLHGQDSLLEQIPIIDTAVAAGVRHIIPSEFGGDLSLDCFHDKKALLWRYKLIVQSHLEKVCKEEPTFGYTLIHVGLITELMMGSLLCNIMGVDTKKFTGEVFGQPDTVFVGTSAKE